jgi:hypothetical protein
MHELLVTALLPELPELVTPLLVLLPATLLLLSCRCCH